MHSFRSVSLTCVSLPVPSESGEIPCTRVRTQPWNSCGGGGNHSIILPAERSVELLLLHLRYVIFVMFDLYGMDGGLLTSTVAKLKTIETLGCLWLWLQTQLVTIHYAQAPRVSEAAGNTGGLHFTEPLLCACAFSGERSSSLTD